MTAVFLIIWFYVYAGLQFGMVSGTLGLFPGTRMFVQVMAWPVYSVVAVFRRFKDSGFGWFCRYAWFKMTK